MEVSALPEPVPYQCFISYRHVDNEDFDGVVDRLKRELAGRFEAATGTRLEVFLDRESIGWGERWRDKIAEAITGSTLFMPIVTMRYFTSTPCREEFSAFYSAAARRGVKDLILPVILAGPGQITSDHPDELVRAVEELHWQPIYQEFEAGYQSAEWKRRIGQLVVGLQQALTRAAINLSEEASDISEAATGDEDAVSIEEIDMQTIEAKLADFLGGLNEISPIMEQVGEVTQKRLAGREPSQMTTGQRAFLFGALADDLRQPAKEFGDKASGIEVSARQIDAQLRAVAAEMYDIDPGRTEEQLADLRHTIQSQLGAFEQFLEQMKQLEKSMRMAALGSVKLRGALRPMTAGLRSLDTTVRILSAWDSIDPSSGH